MPLRAKLCHSNLNKFHRIPGMSGIPGARPFENTGYTVYTVYTGRRVNRIYRVYRVHCKPGGQKCPVYPVNPYTGYTVWGLCYYFATSTAIMLLHHLNYATWDLIMPLNFEKGSNYATQLASIIQNPRRAKLCRDIASTIAKWQGPQCE